MDIHQSAIVLLFLLSAYGWGRLARPWLDRRVVRFHSLTAILGLAGAARDMLQKRPWLRIHFSIAAIPMLVALAPALGAAVLLLPSEAFNHGDDFHTSTPRLMPMLQSSSLGGDAFGHFGLDSLRSQSFFHGFFMPGDSMKLLNGFDSVACFAMCLLLAGELSLRWRLPWWLGASAVLCAAWFNPQFVNVSPIYSVAAGVIGAPHLRAGPAPGTVLNFPA